MLTSSPGVWEFSTRVGKGLSLSLDGVELSLAPGPGRRKLSLRNQRDESGWALVSLVPRSGCSAAFVIEGSDCHLTLAQWPAGEIRGYRLSRTANVSM
jgi:hypothetical protein